jgi:hypothetical protein
MANINLTAADLAAVPVRGMIHEDLMNAVYDISPDPRVICDQTGTMDSGNTLKGWIRESLEVANPRNARVSGSDSTGNDTRTGERLETFHQIASKTIKVSDRASNSDTVGSSDELIRQLIKRQRALRRDEESTYASRGIAQEGDGDTVPGWTAGVGGWIGVPQFNIDTAGATTPGSTTSNNSIRGATGDDPVLSNTTNGGGYPTTEATVGTTWAWSEGATKDMMRAAYENGGQPSVAMSTPAVIEIMSDYLFTSSARVATLQSTAPQGNRVDNSSGDGQSTGGIVAQGSVNVLVTNFGTLFLTPNLFQPDSEAGVSADLYLLDMELWERSYLQGYETKDLARTGIAENREITVDFALCCLNPEGNAVVADVSTTLAGTV